MTTFATDSEEDIRVGLLLDALDEARRHLKQSDQVGHQVTESFPRFVICGPQSTGKSAILSRLSGIKFPQASKRCTRMAAQLILRRDPNVFFRCTIKLVSFNEAKTDSEVMFESNTPQEQKDNLKKIQDKIQALQDVIRTVRTQIMDARLTPTAGKYRYRQLDSNEVVDIGCEVRVLQDDTYVKGIVEKVDVSTKFHSVRVEGDVLVNASYKQILTLESRKEDIVAEILVKATEISNATLRNLTHTDEHPHVVRYATHFADRYSKILKKQSEELHKFVVDSFHEVFRCNDDDLMQTHPVVEYLRTKMLEKLEQNGKEFKKHLENLHEYNTNPNLISTSNDHYLNDVYVKEVKVMGNGASDEAAAELIYAKVRAYLQTQYKFITESAHKEFIRVYDVLLYESFENVVKLMCSGDSPPPDVVSEKMKKKVAKLEKMKKALEDAFEAIKDF